MTYVTRRRWLVWLLIAQLESSDIILPVTAIPPFHPSWKTMTPGSNAALALFQPLSYFWLFKVCYGTWHLVSPATTLPPVEAQCDIQSTYILGKTSPGGAQCFASARLIYWLWRIDLVSEPFISWYWACSIQTVGPCPLSSARNFTDYLRSFTRPSDIPSWFLLLSASSNQILIPPVCGSTVGARAFPVSVPAPWSSLLADIMSINSLPVFHRRLKNYLFCHSYTGTV